MIDSGFRIGVAFLLLALLGGCPTLWTFTKPSQDASADDLYQQAENQYRDKDYLTAVESYQKLKSGYPDFPKLPAVYVKIGDALYANGEYEKAINRYQNFLDLYPKHAYVPRVKYYIAMSYFQQIKKLDLDNAILQKTSDAFKSLAADPNAGKWAEQAKQKMEDCRKMLAEKEMYKARTYWSMGNYKAAGLAAQRVVEQFSNLGLDEEAKDLIKRAKDKEK
jgi:outer membrane protein assembly factor BamD